MRSRKYEPDLCCTNAPPFAKRPTSVALGHIGHSACQADIHSIHFRLRRRPLGNIRSMLRCLWTLSSTSRSAPPSIYASARLSQTLAPLSKVRICTMMATRDITAVPEVESVGPITGVLVGNSPEELTGVRAEKKTSKNVEDEWATMSSAYVPTPIT